MITILKHNAIQTTVLKKGNNTITRVKAGNILRGKSIVDLENEFLDLNNDTLKL